ncbi:MAG: hypothetical protein KAT48_10525 [Bacteroidales bacterium]|nr:hypothetical protein [Bacteroidales bacterium]
MYISKNYYLSSINDMIPVTSYIKYFLSSQTRYEIHSPFLYNLVTGPINDKTDYPAYRLMKSINKDVYEDLFRSTDAKTKKLLELPAIGLRKQRKNVVKNNKYHRLVFRLIRYFNPKTIFDLGSFTGLSAIHMSIASPESQIFTFPFNQLAYNLLYDNISRIDFNNIIPSEIFSASLLLQFENKNRKIDLICINRCCKPGEILKIIEDSIPFLSNESFMIIRDLNNNDKNRSLWNHMKAHEKTTVTVDLFNLGIIFFKKELSKENFIIRF